MTECDGGRCPDADDAGSDAGSKAALAIEAYCAAFSEEYLCRVGQRCGWAAPDVSCEVVTAGFVGRRPAVCLLREREAVDAGVVGYDGRAAQDCLAALTQAPCGSANADLIPACQRIWVGSSAVGQACTSNVECVEGAWCDFGTSCPASCALRVGTGPVTGRDGCLAGSAAVDQRDGGWLCREAVRSGAACRFGDETIDGTSCLEPSEVCGSAGDGGAGVCGAPTPSPTTAVVARGGRCERLVSRCQSGLACRSVGGSLVGTCGDVLPQGASCSADWNGCAPGLWCDLSGTPLCRPLPGEGGACLFTCKSGFRCEAGSCVVEGLLGQACDAGPCEFGTRCLNGVCDVPNCR